MSTSSPPPSSTVGVIGHCSLPVQSPHNPSLHASALLNPAAAPFTLRSANKEDFSDWLLFSPSSSEGPSSVAGCACSASSAGHRKGKASMVASSSGFGRRSSSPTPGGSLPPFFSLGRSPFQVHGGCSPHPLRTSSLASFACGPWGWGGLVGAPHAGGSPSTHPD
jgi:hypothetical protein